MSHRDGFIHAKETVVFQCNDGRWFFEEADENRRIRIGKGFCYLGKIIGAPYGAIFENQGDELVRVSGGLFPDAVAPEVGVAVMPSTDNRHYADTNSAQKLTSESINSLKETKVAGREIIEEIVKNSETWESRTEFSKQKYLKKKQIKYMPRVRVLRANAATLCNTYFSKKPEKIGYLREDSLAQMLVYGNVHADAQILVVDNCMGLLTGAIAERMGGRGRILCGYQGQQLSGDALRRFNFAEKVMDGIIPFAFDLLSRLSDSEEELARKEEKEREAHELFQKKRIETFEKRMETLGEAEQIETRAKEMKRREKLKKKNPIAQIVQYLKTPSDSLMIATSGYDPMQMTLPFLPLLADSHPFCVFHEYLEPLTELFNHLQKSNMAIDLQLSSTFTREHQVLPGRTHPQMTMTSCSGYILRGIKINAASIDDSAHSFVDSQFKISRKAKRARRTR